MPKRTDIEGGRSSAMVAVILASVLSVCVPGEACSMSIVPVRVSPTFTVFVSVRRHGVPDTQLELTRLDPQTIKVHVIGKARTDANGKAVFQNVPEGEYFVRTAFSWMVDEAIEVTNSADRRNEISLAWPKNETVVTTRQFAGILHGAFLNSTQNRVFNIAFPGYAPFRDGALAVIDPITGKTLWKGETDGQGSFSATHLAPGLYVFHLEQTTLKDRKAWSDIDGDIPVEIAPDSPNPMIDLELGMTSCGLQYTSGCKRPKLEVDRVCGSVRDPEGASVATAELLLYAEGQERMVKSVSDNEGKFKLQEVPRGLYNLIVARPGFSSAKMQLSVSGLSECGRTLDVTLDPIGACSTAMVK